jgi:F-type H+-transporting ATPase subunit a
VLAFFTFVITQLGGTKDYWMHIFWPPGIPTFVKPILMPVELLGIFTKPIALAIRLFANMTAGHLVILSLIGLIFSFAKLFGAGAGFGVAPVSVAFALFVYMLELLVSFIQAYVFTMLSSLFIGMAIQDHHHDHDEAHHDAAAHA